MIVRVAILAFVAFAGVSPASADPASEALVHDFVAWVDSSPDWSASVSLVRSEGDDTIAEGLVFSRDDPHVSISIETLRLTGLAARAGGGFSAAAIKLGNGEVVTQNIDAKIPSAAASGASMPSLADVVIDPKHLMTSIARFYAIAAAGQLDGMSIPKISVVEHAPVNGGSDVEVDTEYQNLTLGALASGVLQQEEAGPISIATHGTPGNDFQFTIEKVEVDRIDIGAMARILDKAEYHDGHGDNIWRPLMSHAAYHGLSVKGSDGMSIRFDQAAVESVDGRQPDEPFTDSWDQVMDPSVPADAKGDLVMQAATDMLAAFRVGTIRLDAMSVDDPAQQASFKLDDITLSGWSSAGLDSFILKGLSLDSPQAYLSLGSLELAGFVSPDVRALMQFAAIENDVDMKTHADAIYKTFAALPRLSHFGFDQLVAGQTKADAISLGKLSIDFGDWNKIFAGSTDVHIENLTVPRNLIELEPNAGEMLDGLGYNDITLGMSLKDRWSPDSGTDAATWSVNVANAGDVAFSYTLNGLTPDWLVNATAAAGKTADSQAAVMAMLNHLSLAQATLTVTDHSLLDRAFALVAKRQGVKLDGPAYREQMRAALPFLISAVIPMELANRLAPALQSFMAGGQTLLANVTPPAPLGIMDLMAAANNPLGLPDLLNLKLTSEPAKP